MATNKWRFPSIRGGSVVGNTTGDKEIFRKAPYSSLAREILQNSIDVPVDDSEPVEVDFKTFKIKTANIPGVDDLRAQIDRCIQFLDYNEDAKNKYISMKALLDENELTCLRISDFNATGLRGLHSSDYKNNNFKALVKGTGISIKSTANAGGSKGVGKNAAIVMSKLNLVWYATQTDTNEIGSIGAAHFVSGYSEEAPNDASVLTLGVGFYSDNEDNDPLYEIVDLDPDFHRSEPGTDIIIIGFNDEDNWEKEMIKSIFSSFAVAIYKNKLSVKVNNYEINSSTYETFLDREADMFDENSYSAAYSCLKLLKGGDDVQVYDLDTGIGTAEVYIAPFRNDEEKYATHRCDMIRFPFMRITNYCKMSYYNFSAICIIKNDMLGQFLRKFENPEHDNWQPNYLENSLEKKRATALLRGIKARLEDIINQALNINNASSIDPNKAGEYLPEAQNPGTNLAEGGNDSDKKKNNHKCTIGKPKKAKSYNFNANVDDKDTNTLNPDIGDVDETKEGDVSVPNGDNKGNGGQPKPGSEKGEFIEGDFLLLRHVDKSPIRYKVIATDAENGKYKIVFTSSIPNNNCYLDLEIRGTDSDKEIISLNKMVVNAKNINVAQKGLYGPFEVKANEKTVIEIETANYKGNFASEVRILCK